MITQERALETLKRFDIRADQLGEWEFELGLDIPLDEFGNKLYSPLHVNLFKNIKKHIALGRSLTDIKRMIVLPSDGKSKPQTNQLLSEEVNKETLAEHQEALQGQHKDIQQDFKNTLSQRLLREIKPVVPKTPQLAEKPETVVKSPDGDAQGKLVLNRSQRPLKRFASQPVSIATSASISQPGSNAGLLVLIDRLIGEKDELQENLILAEKQNTHLHQVNEMFQRRVKELTGEIEDLREQLKARENFKLIDDKSRLQKQVIEAEQRQTETEKQFTKLQTKIKQLENSLSSKVDPKVFVGNWLEEAELSEVSFDNFGINIESKRNRMFKITNQPERFFGHTAIIETTYDYQTNALWKRTETLVLSIIHENRLEGELIVDYTLDGTPVAKAKYRVKCHRNGVKTD